MKKRLLLVLLTGLLAVPQVFAASYDFSAVCESGQTLYYRKKDGCISVVEGQRYPEPKGDLIIPATVTYLGKTYSVTAIGERTFYNFKDLTSISIPNSVTEIGSDAFSGCTGLTKPIYNDKLFVLLPKSYKGSYTIPDGITEICNDAFWNCTGLTSVDIPNSVTIIGSYAFSGCTGLTSVDIPNSVTTIGSYAFSYCTGLTKPIYNDKLFVKLPESYSGSYTIPDGITEICNSAFSYCKGLTSVDIPNSVTTIGDGAFSYCTGLTSVDIPNSVTTIGDDAFYNCTGLTSVDIPNSVTTIGDRAFYNCTGLTKPIYNDKLFVKLPESYRGSYIIPDGITEICNSAFSGCTGLTSVSIPNSVTEIGDYAFSGCTRLTSVSIPNSVTTIEGSAFSGCTGLTSVSIPNSVTEIGESAFSGCTRLTSVSIPNSVTTIEGSVFSGCTGLTSVSIPNSVTEIGDYAFSGCTGLTSVNIPNSVRFITSKAFNCSSLKTAYVSVFTYFYSDAFYTDTKLIATDFIIQSINTSSASFKFNVDDNPHVKYYGLQFSTDYSTYYKADANNIVTINDLQPNHDYVVFAYYYVNGFPSHGSFKVEFTTKSLNPTVKAVETTPTSLSLSASINNDGDAVIASEELIFNGTSISAGNSVITGLLPDTEYTVTYRVNTTTGSEETTQKFRTAKDLTLKTLNPKVSEGKVVVCAETNISDYETNAGFEWRKYDAPASLPSKSGKAFLYNGSMKGTIKNLATDSYWNVRAYYAANDGTSYYGDWVTFDPSDFSEFEPEVHTYPATIVPNQPPQLRGYAVEGSDEVEEQGFEYWPKMPSTRSTEPEGIKRIPATGTIMQATLTDYEYSTIYACRSYVVTPTKTYYGEEQMFTTPEDPRPLYTFTVSAGENGRVNEEVNGQYREGESVEITATPDGGFRFAGWSDLVTENPRIVVVTSDTTIVASFEKIEDSVLDLLAEPDKSDVQVSDILGRQYKVANWNNLKGELRRGIYILFKGKESQKILVE